MIKLLRIEGRKVLSYRIFWILTGLYFFFLAAGIILAEVILNNMILDMNRKLPIPMPKITMYFFPDVWQNITFFASIRYVLIFPAIVIIILITNEFTFKTIRQNIVTGLSKTDFLKSKLLLILVMSLVITFFVAAGAFILGMLHSDDLAMEQMWTKFSFVPGFFIQVSCFMIFAFFLGFLLRNTGLSIAIFVLYTLIVEPIISGISKIPNLKIEWLSGYLPVNSVTNVVEYPYIPAMKTIMGLNIQDYLTVGTAVVPLIYAAIMIGLVALVLEKKDL